MRWFLEDCATIDIGDLVRSGCLRGGKRLYPPEPLSALHERTASQLARLPEELRTLEQARRPFEMKVSEALQSLAFAADEMNTRIIAVFTESGLMARRLSPMRPGQRIIALTSSRDVMNELALIWGVEPVIISRSKSTEEILKTGEKILLQAGLVEIGETVVIMAGRLSGLGLSSSVTLYTVAGDIHETVA